MNIHRPFVWLALWLVAASALAAEVQIESLARNGTLTWSSAATNGIYRVEWAPAPDGPWSSSWETLTAIPAKDAAVSAAVPMFYRVVYTPPVISNVTAAQALSLITNRLGTAKFAVVDVRSPGEYASRHVKGALNLNFYAADFQGQLATLDRTKTYLVYCASGSRSGQAVEKMRSLGFIEVYNLTGGLGTLTALPAAAPWLEP